MIAILRLHNGIPTFLNIWPDNISAISEYCQISTPEYWMVNDHATATEYYDNATQQFSAIYVTTYTWEATRAAYPELFL